MPSQNWFYSFERSPTPSFIAAIRRVFPNFEPCDAHWDRLGKTIEFKTGKPVGEVRWMLPEHVEIFLDLFFPATSSAGVSGECEPADDRYQIAADGMNANARKILAAMLEYGATKQADATTRSTVEDLTKLSTPQVKAAIEGEIRRASASLGADLLQGKASYGTWLSPAGIEVAKRIDAKIVKHFAQQNTARTIRST